MLFLSLEDAMQVLKENKHWFNDEYIQPDEEIEDDDGFMLIEQELEQKCFIKSSDDTIQNISSLACDINPKEIAAQIENDNLSQWCEIMQAELNACLVKGDDDVSESD